MKVVFYHDTKITVENRTLYSAGGLNENIIARYLKLSNEFCLATREDNSRNIENLSVLGSLDSFSFSPLPNLAAINLFSYIRAYKCVSEIINKNDFMIIRLPSIIGLMAVYLAKKEGKIT